MTLVIPGVEIRVVKELVPRGLGATGILGIVGHTEKDLSAEPLRAVASLQEFLSVFGAGSAESMPEVRQAFANGVNEVVCANLPPSAGVASEGDLHVREEAGSLDVAARANGTFGDVIAVRAVGKAVPSGELADIEVFFRDFERPAEVFRNLGTNSADPSTFFASVINRDSALIQFPQFLPTFPGTPPGGILVPADTDTATAAKRALSRGGEATVQQYLQALERLETQPGIDLVTVSQAFASFDDATEVFSGVISHCDRMSALARTRIGFGQIPPHSGRPDTDEVKEMAATLTSDRFVLVAPQGYLGAVAGLVGGLEYFQSPTFKTLRGVTSLTFDFSDSDLRSLLQAGVLPVDKVPRRGFAVVRGITTEVSQINVTRIADRAVRHVQNIAQDFIGRLNTRAQRLAIKQLIISAFTRMEQEGALVPSTDGTSPAFEVEVESSQADFAQGIVRVHTAVRPVRAIDFIYATILVQA